MKKFLIIAVLFGLLTSCSLSKQDATITPESIEETPTGVMPGAIDTLTGILDATGSTSSGGTDSGSIITEPVPMEIKNISLDASNFEKQITRVEHDSMTPTMITFMNQNAKSLDVEIVFPEGSSGANLRLSQIIMPDNTSDGPLGGHVRLNLKQTGKYTLIFSENSMAGDPWSGTADISLTFSGVTQDSDVELLQ